METGISQDSLNSAKKLLDNWAIPIIVGLIIVVSIFLIAIPTIKQASQLRNEVRTAKENLSKLTTKLSQLNSINEADLNSQLFEAELALPSKKPIFETLSSVTQQATASGVVLGSFDFSPGSVATQSAQEEAQLAASEKIDPGQLSRMPLSINVTGSTSVVVSFLEVLSNSVPLIETDQVSLTTGTSADTFFQEEGQQDLEGSSANISFDVLFALPPETIGRISDPLPTLSVEQNAALQLIKNMNKYSQEFNFDTSNTGKTNPFTF